ncbi:putative 1-phosphatidylinositol 4,5-bisphosphate phosphodiesterase [Sesbania bispinosa]|nr:putative 1-phosphatidylinositol 4,5-bisphosphate phosphodiesterase [Sesbania bispinosa]
MGGAIFSNSFKISTSNPVATPGQVAVETTAQGGNDQVESTTNHGPVFSATEDLYGDWITITKKKREHKLRGKKIKSNGPDSVGDRANHGAAVSKHQVSTLKTQDSGAAQPFSFGKQDQDSVGPISNGPGPQKILTRNKRPHKEPVFVQPKIFGDEKYKPFLKGMIQGLDPKAPQERRLAIHKTTGPESPKELPSTSTTKAPSWKWNVGVPGSVGQQRDEMTSQESREEGQHEGSGEDQEMVADTYASKGVP